MAGTNKKFTLRARLRSFVFAGRGLFYVLKNEHNIRIQMAIGLAVIGLGILFKISRLHWILAMLCMGLVISAETMNTALEKLTDKVSPHASKDAGLVKDIAAGAVLVATITAVIVGLLIFIPYVAAWIRQW